MPARHYAVRLRAPYELLRQVCSDWSAKADKVLCYEHPDNRTNIHCHLLLYNVYDSTDTLKRSLKLHGVNLKGSGQLSFKTSYKVNGEVVDMTDEALAKYITYMSKGKYNASYNKGYTDEELEKLKSAWVEYKTVNLSKDEILYQEFCQYVFDRMKKDCYSIGEAPTPAAVKVFAHEFVDARFALFTLKARQLEKALIDTYCYRFSIVTASMIRLPFEK